MLVEMAGSRSCGERAFQDNGLDEENAREATFLEVIVGNIPVVGSVSSTKHLRVVSSTGKHSSGPDFCMYNRTEVND